MRQSLEKYQPDKKRIIMLVLFQYDIARCIVTAVLCSKGQYAGKNYSLFKDCNAAAGCHGNARWMRLSALMDCVLCLLVIE